MSEKNKQKAAELPSLEQVVRQIDSSLLNIDDSQALRLGLAAIAGSGPSKKGERFILFSIGNSAMAVSASGVVEVVDLPPITRLPGLPQWVLGIVNVRSEILSVIDLPLFTHWKHEDGKKGDRMIILGYQGVKTGIRVNQILGTVNKDDEGTSDTQYITADRIIERFSPEDGREYHCVDYKRLLSEERFLKLTV